MPLIDRTHDVTNNCSQHSNHSFSFDDSILVKANADKVACHATFIKSTYMPPCVLYFKTTYTAVNELYGRNQFPVKSYTAYTAVNVIACAVAY